jgi:uncharacterized phage protein gp47/JayE
MSNPNDFSVALADVISALEDRVRYGVEQPASIAFIYKSSVASYELPRAAIAVTRVTGMRERAFTTFEEGQDYSFSGARLNWTDGGARPDEGARVEVEYTYREPPSGLTDFNPGSVVGTLLRAAAREMTLLYAQMNQAYRRAFIDDAHGVALDNVVALLGVKRNPALKSKGSVTFLRKRAATRTVVIPAGTRVADQSGRVFATLTEGRIEAQTEEILSPQGATARTANRIAALIGAFNKLDDPATATPLAVRPGFGPDERTITFAALPGGDVRVRYNPKSVTVAIEAAEPGPQGDVNANSIVLMPTPPREVDSVTNEDPTGGGQDAEPDDRLRERAKHALERAGNATLNAIKFAVLELEGVQGVEVLDHLRDEAIPLGEVRVRYSGGDLNAVRSAVERTRAAGVLAKVEEIVTVSVSGVFYLIPAEAAAAAAPAQFIAAVTEAIKLLGIGEPLQVKRLNSLAYGITGVADVAEAQLATHKPLPSSPPVPVSSDPLIASASELIRPKQGEIRAVMLAKLAVTGHARITAGSAYSLSVQLQDGQGNAPVFRNLAIDLHVTARATLSATPTQAPQRVGSFTKTVAFSGSATAALRIDVATDLPDFHADQHTHTVEFVLNAAAYPGLDSITDSFDVTV